MEEVNNVNDTNENTSPAQDISELTDTTSADQGESDLKEDQFIDKEEKDPTLKRNEISAEPNGNIEKETDNKEFAEDTVPDIIQDETDPKYDKSVSDDAEGTEGTEGEEKAEIPSISLPAPSSGYENDISVFCISQQGESHLNNNVPCQDRSEFRWVNNKILIAAIADGVGSCQLSEYGAETAVKSSLDFIEQFLNVEMKQSGFVFDTQDKMKTALTGAMQYAFDSVEKKAEELVVLSYSLQSTLTIAMYDGNTLYFAHAGDDGIVALNKDGIYAMVTARIKGEEASSVFPLQSKRWSYGKVRDAVAFVMATDGVLDAFVRPEAENNRVYYRFIEPVFYTSQIDAESAKSNCNDWDEYLKTAAYRKVVTDDITFVGVVNQEAIKKSVKPIFDDKAWNDQTAEYEKKRKAALYPPQSKKSPENKKKETSAQVSGNGVNGSNHSNSRVHSTNETSSYQKSGKDKYSDFGGQRTSSYPKNPNDTRRRTGRSDSRNMIVNGAKQTFAGMIDISAGLTAAVIEASGEIFTTVGELSEQTAEKIKQNRLQKNQQKSNVDNNKSSSADSNQ